MIKFVDTFDVERHKHSVWNEILNGYKEKLVFINFDFFHQNSPVGDRWSTQNLVHLSIIYKFMQLIQPWYNFLIKTLFILFYSTHLYYAVALIVIATDTGQGRW